MYTLFIIHMELLYFFSFVITMVMVLFITHMNEPKVNLTEIWQLATYFIFIIFLYILISSLFLQGMFTGGGSESEDFIVAEKMETHNFQNALTSAQWLF